MPRAIQIREDNIPMIVADAKKLQFDLSHLSDTREDAAEFGENLYLITDGDLADGYNNITFTTFWESDFRNIWKFADQENPNHFVKIERV